MELGLNIRPEKTYGYTDNTRKQWGIIGEHDGQMSQYTTILKDCQVLSVGSTAQFSLRRDVKKDNEFLQMFTGNSSMGENGSCLEA